MPLPNDRGLLHLFRSGGAPLMIIGLLGRLPTAMTPMLLLVAIPIGGGSLTQAGAAVGSAALGTATSGVVVGLLIDRFGARLIVTLIAVIQSAALIGLAVQFGSLEDTLMLLVLAFVVGVSNPAIGALGRAAWARRADAGELDPPAMRSAMAWEASSSEAAFVIGPVTASLLLSVIEPRTALIGLALVGFVIHLEFVRLVPLHVATGAGAHPGRRGAPSRSVLDAKEVRRPALVASAALLLATSVGLVFGSVQASLNAVFAALEVPALVGLVYGVMGAGSILGGLVWAQIPDRARGAWVIPVAGVVLTGVGVLVLSAGSLGFAASCVVCAVVGLWLSPVLGEAYYQTRAAVSEKFKVTMMTVFASGTSVGVGIGAPLASGLATLGEPQYGFLGVVVAGVAFLVGGGCLLRQEGGGPPN
ncbi:MFS transporter [Nesterenkonia sandarakina]